MEAVMGSAAEAAPPVNKWFVAAAVALGALLEIVDTSIVNVALTDMQAALGATLSQVGWVVTAYGIANVIILPLSAWLGMRFGKKNYFLGSPVVASWPRRKPSSSRRSPNTSSPWPRASSARS
jgi:MFS transporter, DHA2 family, multidrug resistance protein